MIDWLRAWWGWLGGVTLTVRWPAAPSREDWTSEGRGPMRV